MGVCGDLCGIIVQVCVCGNVFFFFRSEFRVAIKGAESSECRWRSAGCTVGVGGGVGVGVMWCGGCLN